MLVLKDFAGGIYKVAPGDNSDGRLALTFLDTPRTNSGKMAAVFTISTSDIDRSRDTVRTAGIDLADHQRLPIALLNHRKDQPIGRTEDPLSQYTVKRVSDNQLDATIYFHKGTVLGEQAFRLVEQKVLCGASIGFLPKPGMVIKSTGPDGHPITRYDGCSLVEISVVGIPDNQRCVVQAIEKGLGGKPLCQPLADMLAPMVETRPAIVTGGWDADFVQNRDGTVSVPLDVLLKKGNTYKTAEPKEVEAQTRSSTYYTCPHCGKEMTHEHMHKDEDGTVRHGECRGAIVLKNPEHVNASPPPDVGTHPTPAQTEIIHTAKPIFPKSLRYQQPKRFLPGLRRKAMPDEFDPNGAATIPDLDQPDEFAAPMDDEGSGMKSGAEAHHGVNDILMQALSFIEDSQGTVDNATAKKTLEKVSKWISKAMAALHAGHASYLEEHPDQPELPGAEGVGPDDEEDPDGTDDFEDDDDDLEADAGDDEEGDYAEGDSEGGSKDKPKKKKKDKPEGEQAYKAIREWRSKVTDSYWEHVKDIAASGDSRLIHPIIKALDWIANNEELTLKVRAEANARAQGFRIVAKTLKSLLVAKNYVDADVLMIKSAIDELKGDVAFEKRTAVKNVVKSLSDLMVTKADKPSAAAVATVLVNDDWEKEPT